MRLDVYIHQVEDNPRLDRIAAQLEAILKGQAREMATMTDLQTKVATQTNVIKSAEVLMTDLSGRLRAAAGDQEAINQLANDLDASTAGLAQAVAANTIADPNASAPTG